MLANRVRFDLWTPSNIGILRFVKTVLSDFLIRNVVLILLGAFFPGSELASGSYSYRCCAKDASVSFQDVLEVSIGPFS